MVDFKANGQEFHSHNVMENVKETITEVNTMKILLFFGWISLQILEAMGDQF